MTDKELIVKQFRKGIITAEEALEALKDRGATEAELNASGLPLERIAAKQDFLVGKLTRAELNDRLSALDCIAAIEDDEVRTQARDDINMEIEALGRSRATPEIVLLPGGQWKLRLGAACSSTVDVVERLLWENDGVLWIACTEHYMDGPRVVCAESYGESAFTVKDETRA